ncbi:Arm DNA-binding domain-containing protein [Nodularia spumigena]|nr:DUF3596 domain-containing protein [Nodularia spumigena]MEA5614889.1 DUF3596 domain-containing protein [Nodularia spumigena UHCC 0040]
MKMEHGASKGSVSVESFQNRLRLRLPRQLFGGKQKYLTLGMADTPENGKLAEAKAKEIELDIAFERFDTTLAKYKPQSHLTLVVPIREGQQQPTLIELWVNMIALP